MTDGRSLIRWVLIVSVATVLQIGLATQVRVAGVHPDLLLLVSICAGLTSGREPAPGSGSHAGWSSTCSSGPLRCHRARVPPRRLRLRAGRRRSGSAHPGDLGRARRGPARRGPALRRHRPVAGTTLIVRPRLGAIVGIVTAFNAVRFRAPGAGGVPVAHRTTPTPPPLSAAARSPVPHDLQWPLRARSDGHRVPTGPPWASWRCRCSSPCSSGSGSCRASTAKFGGLRLQPPPVIRGGPGSDPGPAARSSSTTGPRGWSP